MAQTCTVIQADPWTLATQLASLARTIQIVEKTSSAGKFLIVSDTPATSQIFLVITGDPAKLASSIQTLIGTGKIIDIIIPTFSASHYVVVYR
jgi:hypothetical protein